MCQLPVKDFRRERVDSLESSPQASSSPSSSHTDTMGGSFFPSLMSLTSATSVSSIRANDGEADKLAMNKSMP